MKKIIYLIVFIFSVSCKSYDVEIKNFENTSFKHVVEKTLKQYNAEEEKYSLLIFTNFYHGEKIIVESENKILYQDSMKTIENFGLAKIIRINNNNNVKIIDKDLHTKILVENKLAKIHKYIYVEKNEFLKDELGKDSILNTKKIYKIIYSDSLLGFM